MSELLSRVTKRVDGALVAEPADERELAEVLHVLADEGLALHRDVALSRARLVGVGPVATKSMTVSAGAGVVLQDLDDALRPHALTLGPLTPAAMRLRLGDFLEGPYAGLRSIPGGRLEPVCTSLSALLADGRRLITSDAPRSAAGPDLSALVLGAHGRLGLVTRATVRCFPLAERDVRMCFSFPSAERFVAALQRALAEGLWPWRVHADAASGRVVAEVRWASVLGAVERDRALLARCVEAAGGRGAGEAEREGPLAVEHESTWDGVRSALEAGRAVQLFRLSLASVIARGEVPGVPMNEPTAWTSLAGRLLALDDAQVLGGAL
jgi:FAD/FMN-containing dehydrogenase